MQVRSFIELFSFTSLPCMIRNNAEVEMVEVEMAEVEMVEAVKVATKKPTSSSRTSKRLTHLPLPFPLATRSLGNDERK